MSDFDKLIAKLQAERVESPAFREGMREASKIVEDGMNRKWILDGHRPVRANLMTWAKWYENADLRRVAQDYIGDVHISTVFIGVDHSFGLGEPLLFETMIFGGAHDQYQERYSTWEQAEAGHAQAVALVRSAS